MDCDKTDGRVTPEIKQLPEQWRSEHLTELSPEQRGLAMLFQAAWKASEEGRGTMRAILEELEAQGDQSTRILEHVSKRSHEILEAAEEQSWQACDRLEQVTVDLNGVSDHLQTGLKQVAAGQARAAEGMTRVAAQMQQSTVRATQRLQAEQAASRQTTQALAESQRRLVEQFEASQRQANAELQRLTQALESERRDRRRRSLVATIGLGLVACGVAFGFSYAPGASPTRTAVQPEPVQARPQRSTTSLPAGMRR